LEKSLKNAEGEQKELIYYIEKFVQL